MSSILESLDARTSVRSHRLGIVVIRELLFPVPPATVARLGPGVAVIRELCAVRVKDVATAFTFPKQPGPIANSRSRVHNGDIG